MIAYILNLAAATDRWASAEKAIAETQFTVRRVPAVNGANLTLPHPDYAERLFRWLNYGLKAASVLPFPASQTERQFRTSIQIGETGRLSFRYRWFTTYPYQAFNEIGQWLARSLSIARAAAGSNRMMPKLNELPIPARAFID